MGVPARYASALAQLADEDLARHPLTSGQPRWPQAGQPLVIRAGHDHGGERAKRRLAWPVLCPPAERVLVQALDLLPQTQIDCRLLHHRQCSAQ